MKRKPNDAAATRRDRVAINGRLVAVTATGPIYRGEADVAVLPISVGLALVQELALRIIKPRAQVSSSWANRVEGESARLAWAHACGCAVSGLVSMAPSGRLIFLSQVLSYARRQGNVNGIEPVLCAAVNAAWPWLRREALEPILTLTSGYIRKSEFAAAHPVPVLDLYRRSVITFKPGELAKIDSKEWLNWRALTPGGLGIPGRSSSPSGQQSTGVAGLSGVGVPGQKHGPDLSGYGGPDLSGNGDPNLGSLGLSGVGVPGQTPGPDLSGYGGPDLSGNGDPNLGSLGLSGVGVPGQTPGPDLSGYGGPDLSGNGDINLGGLGLSGLGVPGRSLDFSNLGGNGGPYGFGSALGPGGAATPLDAEKASAANEKTRGQIQIAAGVAIGIFGMTQLVASGGTSPVGWGAMMVSSFLLGSGVTHYELGARREEDAAFKTPGPAPADEKPAPAPSTGPTPAPTPEPAPEPEDEKKKKEPGPKLGDLYPDPDGGGGGNPTQLPDRDGQGGGNPLTLWDENGRGGDPTTIWDENGGGGRPNTIWDENGGGGTPTTAPVVMSATMSSGRGILAGVALVGGSTFAF